MLFYDYFHHEKFSNLPTDFEILLNLPTSI